MCDEQTLSMHWARFLFLVCADVDLLAPFAAQLVWEEAASTEHSMS